VSDPNSHIPSIECE